MRRIISTLFILGLTGEVFSAPSITSISGTFSHGNTVTINGSGFGTKSPATPLVWADFESGLNPTSLGQRQTWDANDGMIQTSSGNLGNSTQMSSGTYFTLDTSRSFRIDKSTFYTTVYLHMDRYFMFGPRANQKTFRIWNTTGATNDFLASYTNSCFLAYNEINTNQPDRQVCGVKYTTSVWLTDEFKWTHGDSTITANSEGNGSFTYTRTGEVILTSTRMANGEQSQSQIRTDNFLEPAADTPYGSSVFMDNIYADDVFSRVIVSSASSIANSTGTYSTMCVPKTWSSSQITCVFEQGNLSNGQTVNLYIYDGTDSVGTPYSFTVGSTYSGSSQSSLSGPLKLQGVNISQ